MKKFSFNFILLAGLSFMLTGCGPDADGIWWRASGTAGMMVGQRDGSEYFISGDEPFAVLIGNKTFLEGGNAVDAAVATAIAMTATQPLSTSLGAGGACQALLPDASGELTPMAVSFNGANPADSMISTLYQIHVEHGRLPWAKVVAPAEKLIRIGFPDNNATRTQEKNPFWKRDDSGLITNPELAESFSTLRLRPLSFIFGTKDDTMNFHYEKSGLGYNQKMTRGQALKTLRMTPLATLPMRSINPTAQVAVMKNQTLTGYGRQWVNYLSSIVNNNAGGKTVKQPNKAGVGLMESAVMAVDASGRALSCHFIIQDSADTPPTKVDGLGFFAPLDGVKTISARGFFVLNPSGTPMGLVSLGQSVRAVMCSSDLAENFFNKDECKWIRNETDSGLAIKGVR